MTTFPDIARFRTRNFDRTPSLPRKPNFELLATTGASTSCLSPGWRCFLESPEARPDIHHSFLLE
jgi:hypothetical protein